MAATIELQVNGKKLRASVDPSRSLLSVLRDDLNLTGTKYGCGEGQCGACTVLVDGFPQRSCQTQAGDVVGKQITTIEGLERDDKLHPLQQAFLDTGAMQCAFCTSGMIMSGVGLLQRNRNPKRSGDHPVHGGQHLSLRHVSTDRRFIRQAAKGLKEAGK